MKTIRRKVPTTPVSISAKKKESKRKPKSFENNLSKLGAGKSNCESPTKKQRKTPKQGARSKKSSSKVRKLTTIISATTRASKTNRRYGWTILIYL